MVSNFILLYLIFSTFNFCSVHFFLSNNHTLLLNHFLQVSNGTLDSKSSEVPRDLFVLACPNGKPIKDSSIDKHCKEWSSYSNRDCECRAQSIVWRMIREELDGSWLDPSLCCKRTLRLFMNIGTPWKPIHSQSMHLGSINCIIYWCFLCIEATKLVMHMQNVTYNHY